MTTTNSHQQSQPIFEWVNPIKTPLINKFYKQHNIRGQAKKCDLIFSLKLGHELVGACILRPVPCQYPINSHNFKSTKDTAIPATSNYLLTGVGIAPAFRNLGYAKILLKTMLTQYQDHIESIPIELTSLYCFAYTHLKPLYQSLGFSEHQASTLPTILHKKWNAYLVQGRSLICMKYSLG